MSFLYESEEEIEAIVRGFENCTMPGDDFHHREHLVVAVCYLETLSTSEAVAKMRGGLLQFLEHHGEDTQKYSEEITRFWIERVDQRLSELGSEMSLAEKCNVIVESVDFIYVK